MGVDYFNCDICEYIFTDCGDCGDCGSCNCGSFLCGDCFDESIEAYGEDPEEETSMGCKICNLVIIKDSTLLDYLLKKHNYSPFDLKNEMRVSCGFNPIKEEAENG